MTVTPEYLKERYWMLKGLGLCTHCGKTEPEEGKGECPSCAERHRQATGRRREWWKARAKPMKVYGPITTP